MPQFRVLVVDDDEPVRLVTSEMLAHLDYDVVVADSGKAALARLGEESFDLVLLDVGMPIMSGTEVFAVIQKNDPNQRVIFMTGYSEEDVAELANDRTRVLPKPFSLQELDAVLTSLLSA